MKTGLVVATPFTPPKSPSPQKILTDQNLLAKVLDFFNNTATKHRELSQQFFGKALLDGFLVVSSRRVFMRQLSLQVAKQNISNVKEIHLQAIQTIEETFDRLWDEYPLSEGARKKNLHDMASEIALMEYTDEKDLNRQIVKKYSHFGFLVGLVEQIRSKVLLSNVVAPVVKEAVRHQVS